jgi:HAD superfamily hydrolase (TIGR01490 family)
VAAFDLDGTLTRGDTLLPFLGRACGRMAVGVAIGRALPGLFAVAVGLAGRDKVKEKLVGSLLAGRPETELRLEGRRFAEGVVATGLRDDILSRLVWHREQGHQVVIVSASLAPYVEPIGELLGCAAVLSTRLAVGGDGRLTGRFDSANCRGAEKAARLAAWIGSGPGRDGPAAPSIWAYGDSGGDRELLAMADRPYKVRTSRRLAAAPLDAGAGDRSTERAGP